MGRLGARLTDSAAPPARVLAPGRAVVAERAAQTAPLGVVVALFGQVSAHPLAAAALLLWLVALTLAPWRFATDRRGELALALAGAIGGVLLVLVTTPDWVAEHPRYLPPPWSAAALAALSVAAGRLALRNPSGGPRATAALALAAVTACGGADVGTVYAFQLVAFLAFQALALAYLDPVRRDVPRRERRLGAVGASVAVASLVTIGLAMALPPLHGWVLRRFDLEPFASRTGFSDVIRLGGLRRMIQSDRVVLHVNGPAPPLLRGVVLTRYEQGRWIAPWGRTARPATLDVSARPRTWIRLVGEDRSHYFLPLGAAAIRVEGDRAVVDDLGLLAPPPHRHAGRYGFDFGVAPQGGLPVARPDSADVYVPAELVPPLRALARQMSGSAREPAARVKAIAGRLQSDYTYALEFDRQDGVDPVLDFLTRDRRGHCEYFASALALMVRALGIPARVIGGFRVTEWNPIGRFHIVRERHAHAWVEVYLAGRGWTTVDPTPAAALDAGTARESPLWAALTEAVRAWGADAGDWLRARTAAQVSLSIAGLLVLWALIRWAGRRRSPARIGTARTPGYADPHPAFQRLADALAHLGERRGPSEPVERYARRVGSSAHLGPDGPRVQRALQDYAALRFGGVGDATAVTAHMDALSRELRSGGRSRRARE